MHRWRACWTDLGFTEPACGWGVGRNLLRGFPVDLACCEVAPPFWISQRSDFEKRYNKPIMLGMLAPYRLFL